MCSVRVKQEEAQFINKKKIVQTSQGESQEEWCQKQNKTKQPSLLQLIFVMYLITATSKVTHHSIVTFSDFSIPHQNGLKSW